MYRKSCVSPDLLFYEGLPVHCRVHRERALFELDVRLSGLEVFKHLSPLVSVDETVLCYNSRLRSEFEVH